MNKVKVSKIEIETSAGKILLTLDEAEGLYRELNKLFGSKIEYVPSRPVIIERDRWPIRPITPIPVWCGTGTGQLPSAQHTICMSLV